MNTLYFVYLCTLDEVMKHMGVGLRSKVHHENLDTYQKNFSGKLNDSQMYFQVERIHQDSEEFHELYKF